jgi:rRNA maturation protein Nop10
LPEYPPEQNERCLAYIPMYSYDKESKKCVQFIYGGCGGTENRFYTIKECIEVCGAKNVLNPPGKFIGFQIKNLLKTEFFHRNLSSTSRNWAL